MKMLAALDASTGYASIAVVRDGHLAAELTWDVGRRHSQELLEKLDWLLRECRATPADLTGVAVARGPGSFNGVRVAVAAAKTLAFALGLPLYAFSTLDVIAAGHAYVEGTLVAILEAGRGELFVARYMAGGAQGGSNLRDSQARVAEGLWRIGEPQVVAPVALVHELSDSVLVCGEWRPETRRSLEAGVGPNVRFAASLGGRHASWLAALALDRQRRGQADDPAHIEPLYLRRPAITVSAKQITLGAGGAAPGALQAGAGEKGDARAVRH
jgi:tRNA threonylcarbamoyladenosine biosynthesis protein TsaB